MTSKTKQNILLIWASHYHCCIAKNHISRHKFCRRTGRAIIFRGQSPVKGHAQFWSYLNSWFRHKIKSEHILPSIHFPYTMDHVHGCMELGYYHSWHWESIGCNLNRPSPNLQVIQLYTHTMANLEIAIKVSCRSLEARHTQCDYGIFHDSVKLKGD